MNQDKDLEELRGLLVGATIGTIDHAPVTEGVVRITAAKNGMVIQFDLCATELGWWISGQKRIEKKGSKQAIYVKMDQMLNDIQDYAMASDSMSDTLIYPIDNFGAGATGFRCSVSDREWLINIDDALESEWGKSFESMTARKELAVELGNGVIPGQFKFAPISDELKAVFNDMAEEFKEEE